MKKAISLILTLVILLAIIPTIAPTTATAAEITASCYDSCPAKGTVTSQLNTVTGVLTFYGSGAICDGWGFETHGAPWASQEYRDIVTSIIINEGITSIGFPYSDGAAFAGYTKLTSVTIANSVEYIQGRAFFDTGLTSVTIPDSVTALGFAAFGDNTRLTTVNISENSRMTTIGAFAFGNCTALSTITLPASITEVGAGAFSRCPNLRSIYFRGDAPTVFSHPFVAGDGSTVVVYSFEKDIVTLYYESGKIGWTTPTWEGYRTQTESVTTANAIYITSSTGGTALASHDVAPKDTHITLTASPNSGFRFLRWEVESGDITLSTPNANPIVFAMPNSEVSVRAVFEPTTANNETGASGESDTGYTGEVGNIPAVPSHSFGNGRSTYTKGSGEQLTLIIQKDFSLFRDARHNGSPLMRDTHYRVERGSTIITLHAEHLETMDAGRHSLEVRFTDGAIVTTSFTVNAASDVQPITPALPVNPFEDVFGSDWFIDAVIYVYDKGLMEGTSGSPMLFSPNTSTTRGMIVTILHRMAGSPDVGDISNPFDDVEEGRYYANAVKWAVANGIVSGYGDGRYGPEDNITREQLAAILNNYSKFIEKNLPVNRDYPGFSDDTNISNYAREAVERLFKASIINGKPGNIFDPQGTATRAEVATMLKAFFDAVGE